MSEGSRRWLKFAIPIAGLSVVPIIGLGYVACSKLGSGTAATDASSSVLDTNGTATKKSGPRSAANGFKPGPPRGSAKLCCEKLHDLAQVAEVDKRATYMAAGTACEAAESDEQALKQVASVIGGDRMDVPPECKSAP